MRPLTPSGPKFDRQSSTTGVPMYQCLRTYICGQSDMGTNTPEHATERVMVLMTSKQKADASRRAKAARLALGDFIRWQIFGDEELLSAVVAQLEESTATATAALDSAAARLADAQAFQPKREPSSPMSTPGRSLSWSPARRHRWCTRGQANEDLIGGGRTEPG